MLRHCGVFLGADAGEIEDRKFHESAGLKKVNQYWLGQLIDFPYAPKGVHQFQKVEKSIPSKALHLIQSIDTETLLGDFFRGTDSISCWGWKDPRNSATAAIWKIIFPQARIVVMQRTWQENFRHQPSKSEAGAWYRQESSAEVRDFYDHPVLIEKDELLRVDFDSLLENEHELNRLLVELGLQDQIVTDFGAFRQRVGIES